MTRPKLPRKRCCIPLFRDFGPNINNCHRVSNEGTIEMEHDEFEAIKHRYVEDMSQKEIAKRMDVSQPTFHRILSSALKKISISLIEGKNIHIKK